MFPLVEQYDSEEAHYDDRRGMQALCTLFMSILEPAGS